VALKSERNLRLPFSLQMKRIQTHDSYAFSLNLRFGYETKILKETVWRKTFIFNYFQKVGMRKIFENSF
jgi:hypothetical protein